MSLPQTTQNSIMNNLVRVKNRIREHTPHGWVQVDQQDGFLLMDCPCGWIGWITADLKENYDNRTH